MVEPYKEGLVKEWGIKKFNLDDLYVRFFRLAERRIAEKTGQGIVCFISNFSYLSDPSFVVMRRRFLQEFDSLWFDCLNGDSRETGKLTPEGKPDPSVFSTEYNREGIRVGTAIGLLVRQPTRKKQPRVLFRQFWGKDKRAQMLHTLKSENFAGQYEKVKPVDKNRLSFCPSTVSECYPQWPALADLWAEAPSNGLMEKRGGALIDIDRAALEKRMRLYYGPAVAWNELELLKTGLTEDAARFAAKRAREKVTTAEGFQEDHLLRYALRPFDTRWCYYSSARPLWNEPRPALWRHFRSGARFLLSRMNCPRRPEGAPISYTRWLSDDHYLTPDAVAIPLLLHAAARPAPKRRDSGNGEFGSILHEAARAYRSNENRFVANLSVPARVFLAKIGIKGLDDDPEAASLIWMHALAIGYSPAYVAENADGVRQDWPRIPLPNSKEALLASADLGNQIAALLDAESPLRTVTSGTVRPELVKIAVVTQLAEGALDLSITAGWGHGGKGGVTMPGKGKLTTRAYTPEELAALESAPGAVPALDLLGQATHDVFLNDTTCWGNVPEKVWDYTIGGYQVIKKWLSYREHGLLGRPLTPDETREVVHMARRIAALILFQPALDRNYQAVKAAASAWPVEAAVEK